MDGVHTAGELSRRRGMSSKLSELFASQRGSNGRGGRLGRPFSEDALSGVSGLSAISTTSATSAASGASTSSADTVDGFMVPHNIRSNVHSNPLDCRRQVRFDAGPAATGDTHGSFPSSLPENSRRTWRRGRRLPKIRTVVERDSAVSTTSLPGVIRLAASTDSWVKLSDPPTSNNRESIPDGAIPTETVEAPRRESVSDTFDIEEHVEESPAEEEVEKASAAPDPGPSTEVAALRAELSDCVHEMRVLQERYYAALHASVQENFLATGALESRLDSLLTARGGCSPAVPDRTQSPSTVLMWTVLDGVSMLLLWIISIFVARPYQLLRRIFRIKTEGKSFDRVAARKSWRLSAGKDLAADADIFFSGDPRRLSFRNGQ